LDSATENEEILLEERAGTKKASAQESQNTRKELDTLREKKGVVRSGGIRDP